MGLDSYLKAKKYIGNWQHSKDSEKQEFRMVLEAVKLKPEDIAEGSKHLHVELCVAYWRKVNAVHNWFVKNCADGTDDCKPVNVSREELKRLVEVCRNVQAAPSMADEFLPTKAGFFFGQTKYDEGYFGDLQNTIEMIEPLLTNDKFKDYEFYYEASW